MIPKKIYYCWFGGPKFWTVYRCIESWKRVLPEYEIVEINESNTDMSHPYIQSCLERKAWAFLSDMARFLWLKDNPGIYLDTDVYMLRPFSEDMLNREAFVGIESSVHIAQGVIGVEKPNSTLITEYLDHYYTNPRTQATGSALRTQLEKQHGKKFRFRYDRDDTRTPIIVPELGNLAVYSRGYFYPIAFSVPKLDESIITAVHLYTCSANLKVNPSRRTYRDFEKRISKFFSSNFPDEWGKDLKYLFRALALDKSHVKQITMPEDILTMEGLYDS